MRSSDALQTFRQIRPPDCEQLLPRRRPAVVAGVDVGPKGDQRLDGLGATLDLGVQMVQRRPTQVVARGGLGLGRLAELPALLGRRG